MLFSVMEMPQCSHAIIILKLLQENLTEILFAYQGRIENFRVLSMNVERAWGGRTDKGTVPPALISPAHICAENL